MKENKGQAESQELKTQGLLDRYLRFRAANNHNTASEVQHLDEDSLAAFVEGNLGERESQPIISHLVDCSFCLHVTAELVRLDMAFASEEAPAGVVMEAEQPSRISEVLNNLLSRIFGTTNDGAVFAHQDESEAEEKAKDSENKEDNK